ncbi:hypothetical protein GGE65_005649 [Skermanella aerolata]
MKHRPLSKMNERPSLWFLRTRNMPHRFASGNVTWPSDGSGCGTPPGGRIPKGHFLHNYSAYLGHGPVATARNA